MKKIVILIPFLFILNSVVNAQQYIVNFKVANKEEIAKLPNYLSVDNYKDSVVTAYLWGDNFEKFKQLGYNFTLVNNSNSAKTVTMATTVAQMSNWDRYPTYDVYLQMMQNFVTNYPNLCQLDTIGTTQQGRLLLALEITDNIGQPENEPEFYYTSTMHGDEVTGAILMLRLIDYLLSNYVTNTEAANLVNNIDIYITPFANPDGTYHVGNNTVDSASRFYNNGVDPNRNFPDPREGDHPDGSSWTVETVALMNFANAHHFVMSANFHGGAEVYNYPWDAWTSAEKTNADDNWFSHLGSCYVDSARRVYSDYMKDVTSSGVTEGADWYYAYGGRQDYMNYFHHCKEVTIELSENKLLSSDQLPTYWNYNFRSLINYMKEVLNGIRGVVLDQNANPLSASITIPSHDSLNSFVVTNSNGDYFRPIYSGTYNLNFASNGYSSQNVNNITTTNGSVVIRDVFFGGTPSATTFSGNVSDIITNENITNANMRIFGENFDTTIISGLNGDFSLSNVPTGTYKITISKENYKSLFYWIVISQKSNIFNGKLIPQHHIKGIVVDGDNGTLIENCQINSSTFTDSFGRYSLVIDYGQSIQISLKANGYSYLVKYIDDRNDSIFDFVMFKSKSMSFEDGVPAGFTYWGGPDWTRVSGTANTGSYSLKSGAISNGEKTSLVYAKTTIAGTFSFYKKVSSEAGYDFLTFYIDDVSKGSWSGEDDWSLQQYTVTAGSHIFKWTYAKDASTIGGSDACWIDDVDTPSAALPQYNITFIVKDSGVIVQNANIHVLGYDYATTDANGQAVFTNLYKSTGNIPFTVDFDTLPQYQSSVIINGTKTVIVDLKLGNLHEQTAKCTIYPNPVVAGIIRVSSPLNGQIKVISLSGIVQKVEQVPQGEQIIDLSNLSSGIYLLQYITTTGNDIQKIVIQK